MRYDRERDTIEIDASELITISRREFSAIPPRDEDEPELSEASRFGLASAKISQPTYQKAEHIFSLSGLNFSLSSKYILSDSTVCTVYEIGENPKKPRRESRAQARGEAFISAYIRALELGLDKVDIKTIFVNTGTGVFAEHAESADIKTLTRFFEKCLKTLAAYAKPEIERVRYRLPTLEKLRFPYPEMREGQREFIEKSFRTMSRGGTLFAAAPTGTGKTVSAIYPALLALGRGKCDRVFYFTPKNTTAIAAAECIELFASQGAKIRAVSLYAKEKLCQRRVVCREDRELCESSKTNRISDATLALYELGKSVIMRDDIISLAKEYNVCPHELALSYSELCDFVILDLNYLFDPAVYLRRHFSKRGNYAFLVDEAHNLPDRAREMYSAELCDSDIISVANDGILGEHSSLVHTATMIKDRFVSCLLPYMKDDERRNDDGKLVAATHLSEIPTELFEMLEELSHAAENELLAYRAKKTKTDKEIFRYLYSYGSRITKFLSTMYSYNSGYETFLFLEDGSVKVKLFCIDPGERIRERIELGRSAVFFSGTLSPIHFYRSSLGGDGSSDMLEVSSPFAPEQLSVSIMDKISTRYSERDDTLLAVSRVIAATVSAKRGNYMIFTPSFAYAEALSKSFSAKYPKIHVITQRRDMSASEKTEFLAEFSKNDSSYLIAFCVMGGIYSEGIDLAGDKLIGAIIVGIGLPSLSYEREAIAAYYQDKYEEGREFAYIYPGINRVLQAAGRVIRREDDRGVIVLVDDRFDDPIYKKLIPSLWRGMKFIDSPKTLKDELETFWQE